MRKIFVLLTLSLVAFWCIWGTQPAQSIPQAEVARTYSTGDQITRDLMNELARNDPNWINQYLLDGTNAITIASGESLVVKGLARVARLAMTDLFTYKVADGDTVIAIRGRVDTLYSNCCVAIRYRWSIM